MGQPRWSQSWYAIASTISGANGGPDLFTMLSLSVAFLDIDYLLFALCGRMDPRSMIGA
jgi:hypothetical protein